MGYDVKMFELNRHREALLTLWTNVLKRPSPQRMECMYRDNTFGLPITSLVFHNKQDLVCSSSVFPRRVHLGGRALLLGINYDMLALPRFRTLGPALMSLKQLLRECEALGYDLLLAMPNEKSRVVFQRAGYKKVGTAHRWSKILKCGDKIRHVKKLYPLKQLVGACVDVFLRFTSLEPWFRFRYFTLEGRYKTEITSLEKFLSEKLDTTDNALSKPPDYLRWRYGGVYHDIPQVFVLYRGEVLLGYVIYRMDNGGVSVEEVSLPSKAGHAYLLLAGFLSEMRARGREYISILYFGPNNLEKKFRNLGFFRREGRDVYVYAFGEANGEVNRLVQKLPFFDADLDL